MDIKNIFAERQKELLQLANTEAGRYLLGATEKDPITYISPNGFRIFKDRRGDRAVFVARFCTADFVARTFYPILLKMDIYEREYKRRLEDGLERYKAFLTFAGLERYRQFHFAEMDMFDRFPGIALAIETFTSNIGGEGRVYCYSTVYATARSGLGSLVTDSVCATANNYISGEPNYYVGRSFTPFDTSALPDAIEITLGANTFIRAVGTGEEHVDGDSISVVESMQASPTGLATSDHQLVGSTKFTTDKSLATWNTSGNNDIQLNADGIANVDPLGYSMYAWRTAGDIANSTPTGNNYAIFTGNQTLLSIEYEIAIAIKSSAVPLLL